MTESEIQAGIDHKTAILLLVKGRELPDYLAEMDLRSRIIAVTAIDKIAKISDLLFEILLVYPLVMADHLRQGSILSSEMGGTLDKLATMAKEVAAQWTLDDLFATYLDAGHAVADAVARRTAKADG